jgi:hypothetical protein
MLIDFPKFDCPVVMTREILTDNVRRQALSKFPKVIDKMRCWDGGLGFYECPEGRRHIYDEMAIVESVQGRLVSTDLLNHCQPFLRYWNGDRGTLGRDRCDCGIYGNYLKTFEGRHTSAIRIGNTIFPGSAIIEEIMCMLDSHSFVDPKFNDELLLNHPMILSLRAHKMVWTLKQRVDESFVFEYCSFPPLSEYMESLFYRGISFIVSRGERPIQVFHRNIEHFQGSGKLLLVSSDAIQS